MIPSLMLRELKASLPAAIAVFAALAACIACIVYMFDPDTAAMLDELMAAMPEIYDAFGMGNDTSTLTGFLLNYLYGFLLTLTPFALVLALANRMVIRPVENGEMAHALASPHARGAIAGSIAAVIAVIMAIEVVAFAVCEIACAELMFPGALDAAALMRTNVGLFAFLLFIEGVCLLSACALRHPAAALWVGGGLCVAEYLVQMTANIGGGLEWMDAFTFFTLFDPYGLAANEAGAWCGTAILAIGGIALAAAAVGVFTKRDLSL